MNNKQREHILDQLDKMADEIERIEDVSKRAEVRGQYIGIFLDLCSMPMVSSSDDDDCEDIIDDEDIVEEPASVTADTDAVVEDITEEEPEEEPAADNVVSGDQIFEDAEEVRVVLNQDDEEVDITEVFNKLVKDGVSEDEADSIGLFLTEYEAADQYFGTFNYMKHGLPRAYAAYIGTNLKEQQIIAYIVDFANLEIDAVEHATDFIEEDNAEALFDFIYQ